MQRSRRRIDEVAGAEHGRLVAAGETDVTIDHVIRLIPWMLVPRRTGIERQHRLHERPASVGLVGLAQEAHLRTHHLELFSLSLLEHYRCLGHRKLLLAKPSQPMSYCMTSCRGICQVNGRMGKLAALHADQTERLILDGAVQLLEQASVSALTVREVARTAGLSERTVFRYFATREELVEAVAREVTTHLR